MGGGHVGRSVRMMTHTTEFPWPDGWEPRVEPRQWRILLANVGITVFGLLFVGFTLQGPVPAGALLWLVFAAGGAGVASWVLARWIGPWRRTTSRIATVDRELVVVHRDPDGLKVAALVFALGAAAVVLVGINRSDGAAVIVGGVGLVAAALVHGLLRQAPRELRGLVLTRKGVRWRSRLDDRFLRWDDLDGMGCVHHLGVSLTYPGDGPLIVLRPRWKAGVWARVQSRTRRRKVPADWDRTLEIPVIQLSAPPALVLWLVRHYYEHPADRAELGTERALDRIRRG